MRRLPVYVLLDCSESMIGDGIRSVREGLSKMLSVLRSDPQALETAYVSIISFGENANVVCPLSPLMEVNEPELKLSSGTAFGAALKLLNRQMQSEVKTQGKDRKGDYRPLVILITDGQPTDDWRSAKQEFDNTSSKMMANFYAIGCGDGIDYSILSEITDIVLKGPDLEPEKMSKLFVWITAAVSSASVGTMDSEGGIEQALDSLPEGVNRIDLSQEEAPTVRKQVLIPAVCSVGKKKYLMRFSAVPSGEGYEALKSHPLNDEEFEGSGARGEGVSSENLLGVPACPYCESNLVITCQGCGTTACSGPSRDGGEHTCPGCNQTSEVEMDGDGFDVSTNLG